MERKKKMPNNKGFTLIELLIVIAIISILAMVAIPGYIGQQRRAVRTEAYTNLENLRLLEEQFYAENGNYTADLGNAGSTIAIRDANLTSISTVLTRFRPGADANYSYRIIQNQNFAGAAQTPCYRSIATGVDGTRGTGDSFSVDCNNNRNF